MSMPLQLADHLTVTAWDLDSVILVLDGTEAVEVHVGVEENNLDELLARVAGGIVLSPGSEGYDLTVVRGHEVLGYVHRRPGLPSTWTRCRQGPDVFGLVEPSAN